MLHDLIGFCRDGQEGFRLAAEAILHDAELKMLLSSFSLQRARFAGELEALAIQMGEHHPERDGPTLKGRAHRGWMHLRTALARGHHQSVLAECERGEEAALEAYRTALGFRLPEPVDELIQRQHHEVLATYKTVRALRDHVDGQRRQGEGKHGSGAIEVWEAMKTPYGWSRTGGKGRRLLFLTSGALLLAAAAVVFQGVGKRESLRW